PPVETRFQKGKSGNPDGRRKKVPQLLDPGDVLQSIDNEELVVVDNGRRKRMTKAEINFRQLFTKAIKGDLKAARLIAGMATKYFAPETRGPPRSRSLTQPKPKNVLGLTGNSASTKLTPDWDVENEHRVSKSAQRRSIQEGPVWQSAQASRSADVDRLSVPQGCS